MGEIADMMLEGILCQYCGEWLHVEEGSGFPESCEGCEEEGQVKSSYIVTYIKNIDDAIEERNMMLKNRELYRKKLEKRKLDDRKFFVK